MKKMIFSGGVLLVLLVFLGLFSLYFFSHSRISGTLTLEGLSGPVTVERDPHGIPHITSDTNDLDAFFALGFVMAQDRLWQLEFNRRLWQGTLSELFGSATLSVDKFFRTLRLGTLAEESWGLLSPQTKAVVTAYTAGINAFLKTQPLPLPFQVLQDQPAPWTVIDVIGAQKLISFGMGNNFLMEWENVQLLKHMDLKTLSLFRGEYPSNGMTTLSKEDLIQSNLLSFKERMLEDTSSFFAKATNNLAPIPVFSKDPINDFFRFFKPALGSNAWVVDGHVTKTGKPLLANDPHLDLNMPGIWYLAEIKGPKFHAEGALLPGIPFVIIGHNDQVAWGITTPRVEITNLQRLPQGAPLQQYEETIKIRNGKPETFKVLVSEKGPVVNGLLKPAPAQGEYLILNSTILAPKDSSFDTLLGFNMATDWTSFRKALALLHSPALNMVYGDIKGNIGYQLAGLIPAKRNQPGIPEAYLPLSAAEFGKKTTYIPFESLPFVYNPKEHFLVSANNKIAPDEYPYELTRYWDIPPYRGERITALLQQKIKTHPLTPKDMRSIQLDTVQMAWAPLKSLLEGAMKKDSQQETAQELLTWNGAMDGNSVNATRFAYWLRKLMKLSQGSFHVKSWYMEPYAVVNQLVEEKRLCHDKPSCDAVVRHSFKKAMEQFDKNKIMDDPHHLSWRQVHQAFFDELGVGKIPMLGALWNEKIGTPGGQETVNPGMPTRKDFAQHIGASYREILDLNNLKESLYIIPTGESDDLFSAHRGDLMPLWEQGIYISLHPRRLREKNILMLTPSKG